MKYTVRVKQVTTGEFELDVPAPAIISEKVLDKAVHDRARARQITMADLSSEGTAILTTTEVTEIHRDGLKVYPRPRKAKA